MDKPLMMKLKLASELYGISYDRLRKWCLQGEIAHVRTGRDFLINTRSLEDMLNNSGLKENKPIAKKDAYSKGYQNGKRDQEFADYEYMRDNQIAHFIRCFECAAYMGEGKRCRNGINTPDESFFCSEAERKEYT